MEAFRRYHDPFTILPLATGAAVQFNIPAGFFTTGLGTGALSFYVTNPNTCWVRLAGSGNGIEEVGPYTAVKDLPTPSGWLLPPGFSGAFSSQLPRYLSVMAVARQGIAIPTSLFPLEITYGGGM